ncbi:hypothetical protein [Brachybacterium sp. Marseille-Q7125]|uniref:MinD/ParA family ATP-binding protein n=1 Tax=Brachybacterium sp. Marseille-Q7125 TaxID=2932815 RepID=UPI001FF67482|nr:hypothetical protein [Brachybacterium sp. Marseille-Q7125]
MQHPAAPLDEMANVPPMTGLQELLDSSSAADTDPRWTELSQQPATQGLRGTLNQIGLSLPPAKAELERRRQQYHQEQAEAQAAAQARQREAEERARQEAEAQRQQQIQQTRLEHRRREEQEQRRLIQTNFQGCRTILVANPKGGSRKTTSTWLLAATLGIIRGGGVIAWDANETMGSLGERSIQDMHSRTVVDLLEQAAHQFDSVDGNRLGTLDRFVRSQQDAHFSVLASDEDATRQDIVDDEGFDRVHEILSRFSRMILVDTGNNIRASHFLAAVETADQLVIPIAAGHDSANAAHKMMRALSAAGHADLVRSAVVLIHDLEPTADADHEYIDTVKAIATDLEDQVAAIVPIPFDNALKGGGQIRYDTLTPATQRAYTHAAAAVATTLRRTTLT